jgi:hypothetical protein
LLTAVETHQNTQDLLKGAQVEKVYAGRGKKSTERGDGLKGAQAEPSKALKREGDPNRQRRLLLDPDQRCCYE